MNNCANCARTVPVDQRKISCADCNQFLHFECLGIPIDDAKRLTRSTSKSIRINCNKCLQNENKLDALMNLVRGISDKVNSFDSRLLKLEGQLQNTNYLSNERGFEDCVQESLARLKKETNLILSGLSEPTNGNIEEKDMETATDLIKKIDPAANIISVRRLGKVQNNRSRLLLLNFSSSATVKSLLRNKNKLAGTKYSKIKLQEDQTKHQLDYLKNIGLELQQRNYNGEQLTIKYIRNLPTIVGLDQVGEVPKN